jgi:hypothetical protein
VLQELLRQQIPIIATLLAAGSKGEGFDSDPSSLTRQWTGIHRMS